MHIVVRFELIERGQIIISWEKPFQSVEFNEILLDQAIGYAMGLMLVRPHRARIQIDYNGTIYSSREFFRGLPMSGHVLSRRAQYPRFEIEESLLQYLYRNGIPLRNFSMNYLVILTPTGDEQRSVIIIQFNHLTFLQGLLSVFEAFEISTLRYIVAIYDQQGVSYTFAR